MGTTPSRRLALAAVTLVLPPPVRAYTRSAVVDPAVAEVVRLVNVARADAGCRAVGPDAHQGYANGSGETSLASTPPRPR